MSNLLGIDYAADLNEQSADQGITISLGTGSSIVAVVGSERRDFYAESDPAERMIVLERDIQLATADLPGDVVPARYTKVTVGTTEYTITSVSVEPEGTTLQITVRRRVPMDNQADGY